MVDAREQANTSGARRERLPRHVHRLLILFVASFEHAQGHGDTQGQIFAYLHTRFPDLEPTADDRDHLIDHAVPIVMRLLGVDTADEQAPFPHVHINEYAVLKTVAPEAQRFARIMNSMTVVPIEKVITNVTSSIIDRDYRYLVTERRRIAREGMSTATATPHKLTDPYFSYVCHYGLHGQSTGIAEFDALYQDVGIRCHALLREREATPFVSVSAARLERVIKVHNRHHPQAQFLHPSLDLVP